MRGILPNNIVTRNGDTLEDDWPFFEENDPMGSYNPLYVDAVVSNPPYSQQWDPEHKENDPRYARFGLAPRTKADYAFLLHDLYHLKPDGIMTIVLPHGVLFRGGEEGKIRKQLIEQNHIHAVIGLPANIFFGTGIPTIILVLRQKRTNTDVLIVDASKHFLKVGKNNKLQASDIKRIADTVIHRESTAKYSKVVSKATIRENDYNLNIPRYVDASIDAESWDLHATMLGGIPEKEINQLDNYWQAFPALRATLFKQASSDYSQLKISANALKHSITQHPQVKAFSQDFLSAFNGFDDYLKSELIAPFIDIARQPGQSNKVNINIGQQEAILSQELFTRLDPIALIDKYQAYQLLDNGWQVIAPDLEMLQSEGFAASKQVDPHIINKKIKGKDTEVQDGWVGHILPFDVVQSAYLNDELQALKQRENRLTEISAEFEALLESLCEEEKEADTIKESNDGFINAAVIKAAKQLRAEIKTNGDFDAESYATKILKVDTLISEEKKLKKSVKTDAEAQHLQTKATIEALRDEQVHELLERKWISPLLGELGKLPDDLINQLTRKVPAIRFKGFSGEWEQKELGDLMEITSASRVHKNEWTVSGVPFFRSSDVVADYKCLNNTKAFISFELYKELSDKSGYVKKDDLLVTGGGSIGIPYLVKNNDPLYFKDADLLWLKNSNNLNGYFLYTFFLTLYFRKYVSSITHIGTISHYTIEQAKSTPFKVSDVEEQTKIGNYFQQLDTLIAQHQQKHDKLLNLKKALLEKMFPKQGEDVPEIRFKGFSGEWKEKELGNEVKIIMGQSPSGINYTTNPEDHILVQGNADMQNGMVVPRIWTKQITKTADAEDLIFSVRAPVGEVGKTKYDIVIGRGVAAIKGNEFIFQSLKKMNESGYWKRLSAGSTFDSINSTDLSTCVILVTSSEEQTKIGNLFKKLDTLLNQHQSQLKKLKQIKQACLAKMFV